MYKIGPYTEEYDIYSDKMLLKFVLELEENYNIEDHSDFYSQLVNFSKNKNMPYHGWFKYREGYSSELVKNIIREESLQKNEYVIDPFCGSGTTLVEAALQGYGSLGIDVNPMSSLVADTKIKQYSESELEEIRLHMEKIELLETKRIQYFNEEYRWEYLKQYFSEKNLNDIKTIVSYVESVESHKIKNFLMVSCLAVTEEISDRKRDGNGLKKAPSKVTNVYTKVAEQLELMMRDLIYNPILGDVEGAAVSSTASQLEQYVSKFNEMSNKVPGAIIFSPPYANSFDYFESYKLELHLGNFIKTPSDMKALRGQAVHSFTKAGAQQYDVDWYIDSMASEIENAIPEKEERTGKKDLRTRKVPSLIRGYFYDMAEVLAACSKVLAAGKRTFIVVDQSAYLGKIVPTDIFLGKIAEHYDFEVEKIVVCRRARTSSQQYKLYPYLEDTLRESIVVLKKK